MESQTSSETVKLAEYLFTRLKQLGVEAIHGVPGDYNLHLLDFVEPAGLLWVGNANELNAGYAADGYARIKGVGALITTYGVGELSAVNSIACAYTERAALVHIVGTPPRASQESRLNIHHTLGDGDYRHFAQMSSHVVAAQTNLVDPVTCAEQIDAILKQCIVHSRPVYIEVPMDMVAVPVLADRLRSEVSVIEPPRSPNHDAALTKVLERIYAAKQPLILVDGEARALGLIDGIHQLINSTKWPTFTTGFGKSLVDESLPNVHGVYNGGYADPAIKTFMDGADLIVCFGPHFSSTNSYQWSAIPKTDITICFTWSGIKVGNETFRDVLAKSALSQLLQQLDSSKFKTYSTDLSLPRSQILPFKDAPSGSKVAQAKFWRLLANFLRPGDVVLGETGTAAYGVREMLLPKHTHLFTSVTWLSIGYMLPAAQGAALAQRQLVASSQYHSLSSARTILVIGDGSFQMTVQELATIIRHKLDVVVFLINNDGYTIERCIHGLNQGYNDISRWKYLQAPSFFGAPKDAYTAEVRTYGDLEQVLGDKAMADGKGLRMVEVFMDRNDAPAGPLFDMIRKQESLQ
ncbi:hypothetical protein H2198_001858 [Neophaeococcomyces mojaviensis]|uniref:Uncharacterized protein n=1 Tax=Neophaeococcomyces mojaviensis TaxID=3383035 RepID=A0ACC3AG28_9EURO|nr:hypothetical protein H2198_001858 [Knufia sp. JES_112]